MKRRLTVMALAAFGVAAAGLAADRAAEEPLSLRDTVSRSAFHDARTGPVRIAGTAPDGGVLVRVTTSLGASSTARVASVRGPFACRYPDDFEGAGRLTPGVLFVDATTNTDFNTHRSGHFQAEITVIVHRGKEAAPELPSAFTSDLLDGEGRRDQAAAQWPAVRALANLYLHSRAARLVHVGRADFDLAQDADLRWFKNNLTLYEFDHRDRDWSKPLGHRVARTFWQSVWNTWFNASNDHPLDGNPAHRAATNYLPYAFANDFADVLIMELMRLRGAQLPNDHRTNLCREATRNLLAMQHRDPGNFALPEPGGRRETYTAGAFRYGMFENGEFMTEGKGWFYNPKFRDHERGGVLNGRAAWGLGEALRHDPKGPLASQVGEGLALALKFCLHDGAAGGYVKTTPQGNVYWRDAGEHAYLALGMLAACEVAPELEVRLAENSEPTTLRKLCVDALDALVDLEQPAHQWAIYPNVDAMAVAALAQGAQLLPDEPAAARWRETAVRVTDAWLAAKVDPKECAGPPVHFGLRTSPGRMTYIWPGTDHPRFFYYQTGHWIQALADLHALTGEARYRERAEAMVSYLCGDNPWQIRLFNELGGVYNWTDDTNHDGLQDHLKQDMYPESTAFCQIGIMRLWQTMILKTEQSPDLLDVLVQRSRQLAQAKTGAARRQLLEAQVQCGPWHAIGPFKDAEYGVFAREFQTQFSVEKDVVARGRQAAELDKTYQSVPVPGALDATRRWAAHPEWADGFYNQLPSGPPPGRNEVIYLYRTITCAAPVEVTVQLVTLDAAKAWLDGQPVLHAPIRDGAGQRFLQVSFKLPLQAGENRLLVKIAKCFQKNGFSFALEGLHPIHPSVAGQPPLQAAGSLDAACEPYASARWQQLPGVPNPTPSWYRKGATWQETLLASRQAARQAAKQRGDLPYRSAILRQKDGPQHVRVNVAGLRQLALACTIGGDNYDYDDTIWADPKLIAADGREVWLTELKAAKAEVGWRTLFVNRNYAGKPLRIGQQEFARGFWAHAPSLLVFDLDGQYEWFDTSFGLDALATTPGTAEFIIADSPDAAAQDPSAVLKTLLLRDFPTREHRHEIERELADGIWDGVDSGGEGDVLGTRYAAAILRAFSLPNDPAGNLPQDVASLRSLYHRVKRLQESLNKLRGFRFEVEPLPTYDPPVLAMQRALDQLEPTPGGAAYLARLAPVQELARAALARQEAGQPGAAEAVIRAAEALDRFREESIRGVGPIVFVRHPTFGRINAVDPYDTAGRGPASIALFDPARPEQPPRVIFDEPNGSVWQASLSYDARTILFAACRPGVTGGWHIYEIGVDGKNLRQITAGDASDIAPVELPSGEIVFVSNRAGNMNVCQANRAGAIYVCDRDGSHVRRISANTLSDHTPAVMDDGRLMFTRWDYGVDKGVFQRHGVWAMNPDGSRLQLFFGNTVLDPNAFWQCVPVPGRPEVVATFGGHHAGPYGVVGLLWNGLGVETPRGEGYRFLTPEHPTYFDGNFWNGYMDPHPLNENEFLVSYGGDGGQKSRLYLMDSRGNKTCVWEETGEQGCYNPLALRPRRRPPLIPSQSEPVEFGYADPVVAGICPDDSRVGTFVLCDIYDGLQGHVQRGEIKALQIMELVPKTRPHTGGYAWNVSPTIGRGTFYVRRLIGTVPVEEDGSAHFTAPALRDISFNALDAEGRVVQKMGSTTQIMPGEQQSCAGCHVYEKPPTARAARPPLAAHRAPSVPARPDWGTGGILDYCLVVQPVWDKHCLPCHSGPRPDGNLDLSGDKTRYFNMSYDMLIDRGFVHHLPQNGADQDLTTPKANGSLASKLVRGRYLEPAHYRVALSPDDFQRVYTWMDANVPYYHTYLYTDGDVNGARDRWYAKPLWASNDALKDTWFQKDFAPVFMKRCYDCHKRTIEISDAWLGRSLVTVTSKVWSDITIMDQGLQIEGAVATFGPEYRINLTHPEWSQMLTAPLARGAGGLGLCQDKAGAVVFKDTTDPDYQNMLGAIQAGRRMLELNPRVDMLPRPDPAHPEAYAASLQRPRTLPRGAMP